MSYEAKRTPGSGPEDETADALNAATMATLSAAPVSAQGHALTDDVLARLEALEACAGRRTRRRTTKAQEGFRAAAGAFLADLLSVSQEPPQYGWVFRSLDANAFSGGTVPYRAIKAVVDGMTELHFVQVVPGYRRKVQWGEGVVSTHPDSKAARFRATDELLQLAAGHLGQGDPAAHFKCPPSTRLVTLKGASMWAGGEKFKGKPLKLPDTAEVEAIKSEVASINAFMAGFDLGGGVHRRFFRGFALGDHPAFRWNKGGRLYSDGPGNYQRAKKAERLAMTIDGEVVVEIDVRASFLTILHGIAQEPLDLMQDPYEIEGVPRDVAKGWVTASLGAGRAIGRWPKGMREDYLKRAGRKLGIAHPPGMVATAMTAKIPLLGRLQRLSIGWADLMFLESQAIIGVMLDLQRKGVPCYPVHDSIIVPASQEHLASAALRHRYEAVAGLTPELQAHHPLHDHDL